MTTDGAREAHDVSSKGTDPSTGCHCSDPEANTRRLLSLTYLIPTSPGTSSSLRLSTLPNHYLENALATKGIKSHRPAQYD